MKRPIGLNHLLEITFFAPNLIQLGETPYGKRIIANIDGGHFEGPNLKGTVQGPGGDWLLIRQDNSVQMDVRVSLLTDDNEIIFLSYQGIRVGEQEVLNRLQSGKKVNPTEYYMRTLCRFETGSKKYAWLNSILAAGTGERYPDYVMYDIYEIT